jgi:hypothetical protein
MGALQVQPRIFESERRGDVFSCLLQPVAITELRAQISQRLENLRRILKDFFSVSWTKYK